MVSDTVNDCLQRQVAQKNLQIETRNLSWHAGHYMAFKYCISVTTHLAANFGCYRFRIMPDIVSKLLRAAIWSRCPVRLDSEHWQTPFFWTGRRRRLVDLDLLIGTGFDSEKEDLFLCQESKIPTINSDFRPSTAVFANRCRYRSSSDFPIGSRKTLKRSQLAAMRRIAVALSANIYISTIQHRGHAALYVIVLNGWPDRLYHPSKSSRHRTGILVGGLGRVYLPSQFNLHPTWNSACLSSFGLSYHPIAWASLESQSSSESVQRARQPILSSIEVQSSSNSGRLPRPSLSSIQIIHSNPAVQACPHHPSAWAGGWAHPSKSSRQWLVIQFRLSITHLVVIVHLPGSTQIYHYTSRHRISPVYHQSAWAAGPRFAEAHRSPDRREGPPKGPGARI